MITPIAPEEEGYEVFIPSLPSTWRRLQHNIVQPTSSHYTLPRKDSPTFSNSKKNSPVHRKLIWPRQVRFSYSNFDDDLKRTRMSLSCWEQMSCMSWSYTSSIMSTNFSARISAVFLNMETLPFWVFCMACQGSVGTRLEWTLISAVLNHVMDVRVPGTVLTESCLAYLEKCYLSRRGIYVIEQLIVVQSTATWPLIT